MKKRFLLLPLLLLIVLAFLVIAAPKSEPAANFSAGKLKAAWGSYGLEINNTLGNTTQQEPRLVSGRDGTALMVWEDGRSGYTKIYAQKLDANGNQLWSPHGNLVCDAKGNQNFAQLIEDGSGGLIVVWQDYRSNNSDIYAQRLSAQGQALWSAAGVLLCNAEAGQFAPVLVSDGQDGAIVTWHDYRSGSGEDIYAQRVASNGQVLWPANGLAVCDVPGTQWYPQLCSDGDGGAIIVWTDGRTSSGDNNIYGQRLTADGKAQWEKNGLALCLAAQNQERPVILPLEGAAILVWQDGRNGNVDLFAQKIDLSGKPLWNKDGVAVTTAPYPQENPKLAPDGSGGAVVVWSDKRDEESGVYTQRLMADGRAAWGDNGRPIAKTSARQENPDVVKLRSEEWIITWEDYRRGMALLYAQKISPVGVTFWEERGVPLAYGARPQEKAAVAILSDGNPVIAWQDQRQGNSDLYAQKLSTEGALLWGDQGLVICDTIGWVVHQNAALVDLGKGTLALVFEDARSGYNNIYAQKIDKNGVLLWGRDGIPVAKVRANQTNPQAVGDGAGGIIVAWEDYRDPNLPRIFAQRIKSNGAKGWAGGSLPIAKVAAKQTIPLMVTDGKGGAIIVWQDERNTLSLKDLYGQRLSAQGELLWEKTGTLLAGENGDQVEAALTTDGANGLLLAWTDFRRGERNPDIYLQRIGPNGKPLWDREGILICGAPDVQRTPQLSHNNQGETVVTWTDKGGGSYDIYAQAVNPEGKILWLTDGIPVSQGARTQQNPALGGQRIVVWEDYRFGNWDIYANALSSSGKLLWGEEGVPLASLPLTQYAPEICSWKDGGVIVAWEDYRNAAQYEIFLQKVNPNGTLAWSENGLMVKTTNGARRPKLLALPEENALVVVWEDYTDGGKAIFGQKYYLLN